MSLRARLNLLITLLSLIVIGAAFVYTISNARRAVDEEMQSTAHLALQLVEIVVARADAAGRSELQQYLIRRFAQLESTRHLQVAVLTGASPDMSMPPGVPPPVRADAPGWFVDLVEPRPMEFRRRFAMPGTPYTEILIRADPSDEITEVWSDTKNLLLFLVMFVILANVLVYLVLGRELAPIETILQGLERIEKGDYRPRLPRLRIAELSRIADKFNRMAEVLNRSREENRILTQRSLEIQERERRQLARELHDELGQSISAIKAVAASIGRNGDDDPAATAESVSTIIRIADHTYDVTRDMTRRLRPSVLDELGLRTALQELVDAWNTTHGDMFCHLDCAADLADMDEETAITVYRVIQEGLTNAAKHAGACEVSVVVALGNAGNGATELNVCIDDQGRGFDPASERRGLGILGMGERVEALGGDFVVHSEPGKGVRIKFNVPVPGAADGR